MKPKVENRTEFIGANLKPSEKEKIVKAAEDAGMRLSEFIVTACMDKATK